MGKGTYGSKVGRPPKKKKVKKGGKKYWDIHLKSKLMMSQKQRLKTAK